MIEVKKRVDTEGRAFAGSQLQTQIYVSRRPLELSHAVGAVIQADPRTILWRSPLAEFGFREPMDGKFLDALELGHLRPALRSFWPKRGPSWDALGVVRHGPENTGCILVEGKSYPAEMQGGGCAAAGDSRTQIAAALGATKVLLGAHRAADWMGPYYQYANRLAHAAFLRVHTGRPAWLVNVCFTDDPTLNATSLGTWEQELSTVKSQLGFERDIPFAANVFLPGFTRAALVEE